MVVKQKIPPQKFEQSLRAGTCVSDNLDEDTCFIIQLLLRENTKFGKNNKTGLFQLGYMLFWVLFGLSLFAFVCVVLKLGVPQAALKPYWRWL